MRNISHHGVPCAGACLILAFCLLSMASCASAPPAQTEAGVVSRGAGLAESRRPFETLWAARTIELGAGIDGADGWQTPNPFSMLWGGGARGEGGRFPIRVTATLVDSILVEAGLAHYARLLEMDKTEEDEFRRTYFDKYDPADYVLVWCELRTSLAENYLDYHRWIIYLEDDSGSQCESVRPLEGSQLVGELPAAWHYESRREQEVSRQGDLWQGVRWKSWMLRFPRNDINGRRILREGTRSLRLVFLQSDKEKTRSGGSWRFVE